MYNYSPSDWILFFYIYCFCGWVWETVFVSLKKRKFVNRGFLHGPFLPIYGSGAVCVLLMTIPFKDNLITVFFVGMTGATILEYMTGLLMEKLFGIRYWDYSKVPLNLNGYICLFASLGWGLFSVLMVSVGHAPVEHLVLALQGDVAEGITIFVTVLFVTDFTKSFQEAMDLKELMEKVTESNEEIRHLQKRMDVLIAVLNEEADEFKERTGEGIRRAGERIEEETHRYVELVREYKERSEEKKQENLENRRQMKREFVDAAYHYVENLMEILPMHLKEEREEENGLRDSRIGEALEGVKASMKKLSVNFEVNRKKVVKSSMSILHRNPGAFSKKYKEALQEMKKQEK